MKADEPSSSAKHGDISPIIGTISNLVDDPKASTSSSKSSRKTEPAFEMLPNFSRVTPAQLAHITFPPEGRYQPVRAVSTTAASTRNGKAPATATAKVSPPSTLNMGSEKYSGGGIMILADLRPDEPAEFIDFEPAPIVAAEPQPANGDATGAGAGGVIPSGPHISLDESAAEAAPPESFEVSKVVIGL